MRKGAAVCSPPSTFTNLVLETGNLVAQLVVVGFEPCYVVNHLVLASPSDVGLGEEGRRSGHLEMRWRVRACVRLQRSNVH